MTSFSTTSGVVRDMRGVVVGRETTVTVEFSLRRFQQGVHVEGVSVNLDLCYDKDDTVACMKSKGCEEAWVFTCDGQRL